MKKVALILLLSVITVDTFAQSAHLAWARQLKANTWVNPVSIAIDNSGNVFTAGDFQDTVDFDPGPNFYNLSFPYTNAGFISKLDSSGNFLWAMKICGNDLSGNAYIRSICLDAAGDVYAAGVFGGTVDFDPGPGVFNMTVPNGSGGEIFICKLDNNSNFIWAKKIGPESVEPLAIKPDAAGNIYCTGVFWNHTVDFDPGPGVFNLTSAGSQDGFILKLDGTGNFLWAKQIAGPQSNGVFNISFDNQGYVYTGGSFRGVIDADPGPATQYLSSSGHTCYISKLDNAGNFIWAKQIDVLFTSPNHWMSALFDVDPQGNIYLAGTVLGQVDLDPGPGSAWVGSNAGAMYTAKWNTNGNYVWSESNTGSGDGIATSICAKNAGTVLTTGYFEGTVNFGAGYPLTAVGYVDAFVRKMDNNGNTTWLGSFSNTGYVTPNMITTDSHDNIYTIGEFGGTVDFDPNPGVFNLTRTGLFVGDETWDGFVVKLKTCQSNTFSTMNVTTCDSFTLNNHTYTSSGTYTQTLQNTFGCDSMITLNLVINQPASSITTVASCDPYQWQGQLYAVSGTFVDTLQTINGCDSILNLVLTMMPKSYKTITASICPGGNYSGYTTPGIYVDTFVAANGCDSIRTLNLTVAALSVTKEKAVICKGENYMGYTVSGIFRDTLTGCLVHELTLTVEDNCDLVAVPNAFTPDGDGLNDLFKPVIRRPLQQYRFKVFNRWGLLVFETTNYSSAWDGSFKGKPQPPGTYVYTIYMKTTSGNEKQLNGTVQVIR